MTRYEKEMGVAASFWSIILAVYSNSCTTHCMYISLDPKAHHILKQKRLLVMKWDTTK